MTFAKDGARPMRRANADEMLERIVRAVRRAGSQAQKVPCARGGHRRSACVRRLRVDGQVHALHVLTNVHARRNRRARYTQVTLERKALAKVTKNLYYLTHGRCAKLILVPSKDLLRAFFIRSRRARHIAYINLDGTPGRVFDFWQYEDAW